MSVEFEKLVLQKLDETQQEVKDISQRLDTVEEKVEKISHQVDVMKVELTRKVDVLYEAFTMHGQKHEAYEKAIASLNAKFFNHDIRISNLEGQTMTV